MSVRGLTGFVLATAALSVVTGAAAAPPPVPGERAALAAVKHAVAAGRLSGADAKADRAEIARAVRLARGLPPARGVHVEVALEQIGVLGKGLTAPRATAVFGQLRANDDWFARRTAPKNGTDITDADGIVYRYFPGRCFEFHPLANVSALNARVAAKDVAGAQRLAGALEARAVPRFGGMTWEYYFPFGGSPPWVSGMAQAVGAQAFARAAALVTDESADLLQQAAASFRAVPRLTMNLAAGPWIRLYSFSKNPVLNAQLQSVVSLQTYAQATGDTAAASLAAQMQQAAAATVSRFDTGYWTYYSLAGNPSPLSYQKFVVQLLHKLGPSDPRFAQAADRFAGYLRQPPAFKLATTSAGSLRFWLSKPASVSAWTPAGRSVRLSLDDGWHTFHWEEPKHPGFYAVHLTAVDYAGNRASFEALPIVKVLGSAHRSVSARKPSAAAAAAAAAAGAAFAVGAGIDEAAQAALAGSLGMQLVRLTVPWQPGQMAPDPAIVSSLQSLPPSPGLVLELNAPQLPAGAADRAALGRYAASLAQQAPSLRDLVLTPAPSVSTASDYADALAAVRAAVVGARPDVAVGPAFDGSTAQPQNTAVALAQRLAQDGGQADVVSFLPAPVPGSGVWAVGDVKKLESALAKGLRTAPPILLAASPTSDTSSYAAAIESASCLPGVTGLLLDQLVDGAPPAPPTGLYDASGDPKPSAAAVNQAIREVARGAVVCPGRSAKVTPTTLTFPDQLSSSTAASVALGCDRDCLYLVALDRADGQPLVASRGSLNGGDPAKTITLPKRTLPPGGYRLDVRLVSRVGPGVMTRRLSPLLTAG
ncbi:MAG TPA: D-glucuronyl C5-epimerase family protein [Gaiellaceae bacterium]|nr:D-glucuronyl C5-epimerase family protein [Gaiellaceae bacterium]